jgi:hypothetical protein
LKKNDIPIIAIYGKESMELIGMLKKLNIMGVSINELDFVMDEFFKEFEILDNQFMIDISRSDKFKPLYRKTFNGILKKWVLFE